MIHQISILVGSLDWFKGKITGKSHISLENRWFPVDFPLSQPIDWWLTYPSEKYELVSWDDELPNIW